jgi:hypothetical protein
VLRTLWLGLLMAVTPIFCCGAECGDVTAGATGGVLHWNANTGTLTADTVTFHGTGLRSYKFSPAGAVSNLTKNLASPTVGVVRCYIRFNSLPAASTNLMAFVTSGSFAFFNYNQATNKFRVAVTGNGATGADVGPALNANQWYRVDFRADVSANPWKLDTKIDGSTETQFTNGLAATTFSSFKIGGLIDTSIGTPTLTVYIDEIILSTTGADWPIGAGQIIGLSPAADGTHVFNASTDFQYQTGVGVAVGATDTWNHVKSVPLTQITTFMAVTGAANTEYLEWTFGATGTDVGSINGVEVVASNFASGTSASKQTLRVNDGGTTNDVYTDLSAAHTAIGYSTKQYATAPTGGAWTKAKVDALRARWNSSYGTVDESPVPRIAGVMFEVDYVPSSNAPSQTDTLTLADVATPVSTQSQAESVNLADVVTSDVAVVNATDALSLSESAAAQQGSSQAGSSSDTETVAESAAVTATLTAADAFSLVETPVVVLPTIASDTVALAETFSALLTLTAADALATAEAFAPVATVRAADGPSVAESASATQGTGNQIATASDALTLTDTVAVSLIAMASDAPGLSEQITDVGLSVSDALTLTEFGQGVAGQQMHAEAIGTVVFSPRMTAVETTLADVQGAEGFGG